MSDFPEPKPAQPYDPGSPPAKSSSNTSLFVVLAVVLGGVLLMSVCVIGGLVALLLPAIHTARDAARRMESSNHVKQIALGLLNYESVYGHFPPQYSVDEQGNPLHSWRMLILPMMEQQHLFDEIDMDKPWDDPANAPYTETAIRVYESPRSGDPPGMATYVAVAGPGHTFDGSERVRMGDIRDGASLTIMVVEIANSNIPWAKPQDITLDDLNWETEGAPRDAPNLVRRDAVIGYADGSVQVLQGREDRQWLKDRLTISGGERVDRW